MEEVKRVLVLHSYSTDYQWTNGSKNGIIDEFHDKAPSIRLRTEFMDTKNYYSPEYLDELANLYALKYHDEQPDGIIVTDNNALTFIEKYGPKIFPNTKVVATGINNALSSENSDYVKSIIAEQADHLATIRQALRFWPGTRNLFVIADSTPTGDALLKEVMSEASKLKNEIAVTPVPDMTMEQLEHFVTTRHSSDLIYILPFFKAANGKTYAQGDVERHLASMSTTPMIASWAFQMDTGVVGGRIMSARGLGIQAADTMLNILKGKDVPTFQSSKTTHTNVYDYSVAKRFNIDPKLFPMDTVYINRPLTFFEEHKAAVMPAGIVIGILAILTVLLNLNLQKQRRLNANNQKLMAMDKEVIETQRELVTTLGEIIEVRSQETGNHVKRVAKLSRMLGKKLGLKEHHLDLLEAASPLHDVGKIGIPEAILHKPGKLTAEEYEIIKSHPEIGKSILEGSSRELMKISCEIAHQHHERWDGSGYPNNLSGDNISIYARITTLADVYDALSSDRCYKEAWPEHKTIAYIKSESGKTFDPQLVDVFLKHIQEARDIRAKYPNETDSSHHHHSSPRKDTYSI